MNIQQMHIEFNLSMQKIASNVKRNFYPEEIDWVLNKMITRFEKSKIKPNEQTQEKGFQSDEIDLNALRTLIELDYPLPIYKSATTDKFVCAELPGNYSYLIEDYSGIVRDCHDTYEDASDFILSNEYAYYLKIIKATKSTTPWYTFPVFYVNNEVVLPATTFPTSMLSKDMNFVLEDILKNNLLDTTTPYRIYWERYKTIYKPETLILVSSTELPNGMRLTFDSQTITFTSAAIPRYLPGTTTSKSTNKNRLIRSSFIGDLQKSSFAKSQWESPISNIQNNTLKVYHDDKFIVNNLSINYIRKPKLVSLSLGQGCDLPEEFHPDICDFAVEYVKQAIQDPNYQWKLQDNQLRRQ